MKTQSTNCVVSWMSNAGTQQFLLQFIVYEVVNDKEFMIRHMTSYRIFTYLLFNLLLVINYIVV